MRLTPAEASKFPAARGPRRRPSCRPLFASRKPVSRRARKVCCRRVRAVKKELPFLGLREAAKKSPRGKGGGTPGAEVLRKMLRVPAKAGVSNRISRLRKRESSVSFEIVAPPSSTYTTPGAGGPPRPVACRGGGRGRITAGALSGFLDLEREGMLVEGVQELRRPPKVAAFASRHDAGGIDPASPASPECPTRCSS